MQGDVLFPDYLFFCLFFKCRKTSVSNFLLSFVLWVFFFCFGLFFSYYYIPTTSPNSICSLGAGSAHGALSLWLSLVFPLVKFFGFGWRCWSALRVPFGRGHCLGSSLSVREGYIHWLVPAGAAPLVTWRGVLMRRCPAGASVPAV